ncbi:hypothetical protein HDK90DRAFT_36356 [Phyllosticta capitalensis]|uniref:Serine-rich protein n=1 Tax=Phyllosticta capitalensis TaxID=121624 RepID=A0ABR1Z4B2_9PEZI
MPSNRTHKPPPLRSQGSRENDLAAGSNKSKSGDTSNSDLRPKDQRGRSKSAFSSRRQPLGEISPANQNTARSRSSQRSKLLPPLLRIERELERQRARERKEQDEAAAKRHSRNLSAPSPTLARPQHPFSSSQALQPGPASPGSRSDKRSSASTDTPEFFNSLLGPSEPSPQVDSSKRHSAGGKSRQSISTIRSVTDKDRNITSPSSRHISPHSRESSRRRSGLRSVEPAEESEEVPPPSSKFPGASDRSSASSETLSTRCHVDRKSTGSNWTLWPPSFQSARRPSSTPAGLNLSGIGDSDGSENRPVTTSGRPLEPFLDPDSQTRTRRPSSTPILSEHFLSHSRSHSRVHTVSREFSSQEAVILQYPQMRDASAGTFASVEYGSPAPIHVPRIRNRNSQALDKLQGAQQTATEPESEASIDLPSAKKSPVVERKPVAGEESQPAQDRNPTVQSSTTASIYTRVEGTATPATFVTDRPRKASDDTAYIPPLRNPWQSVDSMSFAQMGFSERSWPLTRPGSNSSNSTVVHVARTLPAWARTFYSTANPSSYSFHAGSSRSQSVTSLGTFHPPKTPKTPRTPRSPQNHKFAIDFNHSNGTTFKSGFSRPTSKSNTAHTAPTASPSSSEFSIARVHRPRNRPHSTIYSANLDDDQLAEAFGPDGVPRPGFMADHRGLALSSLTQESSSFSGDNSSDLEIQALPTYSRASESVYEEVESEPRRQRFSTQSNTNTVATLATWYRSLAPPSPPPSQTRDDPRVDRQIYLFAFGFFFPFAWMVGAFLRLPPPPPASDPYLDDLERGHDDEFRQRASMAAEVHAGRVREKELQVPEGRPSCGTPIAIRLGEAEAERAFARGLYWRRLNRIFSVFGTLAILLIIVLAAMLG